MKYLKMPFVILRNFFLIVIYEIRKLFRGRSFLVWILLFLILAAAGGGFWGWKKYQRQKALNPDDVTLEEAAKMGEIITHKLMVQIEVPKGKEEDLRGRYQRGDIVLIKPGDFEFSEAEKTGFLILKMDITEKQAEVLVRSLEKDTGEDDPDGRPRTETLARRKFSVDLKRIGLADDDQKGREMDQIFKWDVVRGKEK
jgi:hypothetical protein